jgi:hypothetical protein
MKPAIGGVIKKVKTMSRLPLLAVLAITFIFAAVHAASAQVVAYRHRSTVLGDHLAGASELIRAQGSFLVDEATAAETWVRTEAARDALLYQRAEYHFQTKQMYQDYLNNKAADRRDKAAAEEVTEHQKALRLWQAAQRGGISWPTALNRPEYASSRALIDSILRTWTPEIPSGDIYRRALATETAVLRTRVASNTKIPHPARVAAVQTLERIQRLAETEGLESIGGGATGQIAMR